MTADAATPDAPTFEPVRWTRPPRGVAAGVSTRGGGVSRGAYASLNLSFDVGDDPSFVAENRARAAAAFGFGLENAVLARQVHGADVFSATRADGGRGGRDPHAAPIADAIVAADDVDALIVGVADCAPVFLATEDGRAIAIVHAGWRGVLADVLPRAIDALLARADAAPKNLVAAIGPNIGPCCFETGEDVAERFRARFGPSVLRGRHVDLRGALLAQLAAAGVEGVLPTPPCTRCASDRFFSHRAAKGAPAGRMWGVIRRAP